MKSKVRTLYLQDLIRDALNDNNNNNDNEHEHQTPSAQSPLEEDATIIVDLGGWQCRAGWSSLALPSTVLDSTVHRWKDESPAGRKDSQEWQVTVGRTTPGGKSLRTTSRQLYDGPLLLHTPTAENVLDCVLGALLAADTKPLKRPLDLILTEPVLSPLHCRQELAELVLEGYASEVIGRVAFVLDAPLAAFHTLHKENAKEFTALVVAIGTSATHILPIVQGELQWKHARRINWGTNTGIELLQKMLVLKYPGILATSTTTAAPSTSALQQAPPSPFPLTLFAAGLLFQELARVVSEPSPGYDRVVRRLADTEDDTVLREESVVVRLFGHGADEAQRQQSVAAAARLVAQQQAELAAKRAELADRLRRKNAEEREAKLRSKQHIVATLKTLIDRVQRSQMRKAPKRKNMDDEDGEEGEDEDDILLEDETEMDTETNDGSRGSGFSVESLGGDGKLLTELHRFGYRNMEALQEGLRVAELDLARASGTETAPSTGTAAAADYALLDVPDAELDEGQLREKRRLRLLKAGADARERLRAERAAAETRRQAEADALEQLRCTDLSAWRARLYGRRRELIRAVDARQRAQKAITSRRSATGSSRLRTAVAMAGDGRSGNGTDIPSDGEDDGFGMNDDDWLVYRHLSGDNEDETVQEQQDALVQVEGLLEAQDHDEFYRVLAEEAHQALSPLDRLRFLEDMGDEPAVLVNVERWRCTEGLFQPAAIHGIDQAGLGEVLHGCLMRLKETLAPAAFATLLDSVTVTGSAASRLPGLVERIAAEIREALPEDMAVRVTAAESGLDAWKGARDLVLSKQLPQDIWVTREEGQLPLVSAPFYCNPK